MAVTAYGQRPEMPADPVLLLGGSFPGLPEYRALMEACWDADPAERPSAEQASFLSHASTCGSEASSPRLARLSSESCCQKGISSMREYAHSSFYTTCTML